MKKCSVCGKEITEGYVWDGTDCFCSEECLKSIFPDDPEAADILIEEGERVVWEQFMEHEVFCQVVKGKYVYTYNGKTVRNSKRQYKLALVGAARKSKGATGDDANFRVLALGNSIKSVTNDCDRIYRYMETHVVNIINK